MPIPVYIPSYHGHVERGTGAWWTLLIANSVVLIVGIALLVWMTWDAVKGTRRDRREAAAAKLRREAREEARRPFLELAEQLEGPGWDLDPDFEVGIREAARLIRRAAEGSALRVPPAIENTALSGRKVAS